MTEIGCKWDDDEDEKHEAGLLLGVKKVPIGLDHWKTWMAKW